MQRYRLTIVYQTDVRAYEFTATDPGDAELIAMTMVGDTWKSYNLECIS